MKYLIATTFLWAFSFSLIGEFLAGSVNSYTAAFIRSFLALLTFTLILRKPLAIDSLSLKLIAIGGVQLGLMYVCYFHAFNFLSVPLVLLFTILTPIYVTLIDDLFNCRFQPRVLLVASLAVIGAFVIRQHSPGQDFWFGFAVLQGANVCFAFGQVAFKRLAQRAPRCLLPEQQRYFFLGATLVTFIAMLGYGEAPTNITLEQIGILIWLGVVASGVGYFWWNRGAATTDTGTLAIMNNAVIPVGLAVNLALWGAEVNVTKLLLGGAIILLAMLLHRQLNAANN
ncbi:EamA family transporter [Umboniibacter marinipuniceus]|uniref:Carboxylate/amino acid/amine transporter n=1 Tax=Umboniibacter marinipuniceus TaxID=569599 RepID=A0A3M0ALW5_9GAMM|nr:EamA family transporter [Umboniibacter marinipuniceus]RMA79972.1 carboxylate/amino acid/amine transporter [Umboniibacter marinipuniceus]